LEQIKKSKSFSVIALPKICSVIVPFLVTLLLLACMTKQNQK
jgi:hypothetical protein